MAIKQKSKEETDRDNEIAILQKAVERAEGRGQKDTSHHVMLERLLHPPKETKEIKE